MAKWLAVLCACLAFAVAACGDDEESSDTGGGGAATTTEEPATTEAKTDAVKDNTHKVAMKDIQYDPAEITVKSGDIVKWTNDDDVGHDVTGTSGPKKFKSGKPGAMGKGDSFATNFVAAGKYDYVCTVHANMKGTVTVE